MLKNRIVLLSELFRMAMGIMFIYSCIHKITHPHAFLITVENYEVLPDWMATGVAALLPWFELIIGICLLLGIYVKGSCILTIGMFLSFAYGIGFNLIRGRTIDCGCFTPGSGTELISWWSFIREFLLIGIIGFVMIQDTYPLGILHLFIKKQNIQKSKIAI